MKKVKFYNTIQNNMMLFHLIILKIICGRLIVKDVLHKQSLIFLKNLIKINYLKKKKKEIY